MERSAPSTEAWERPQRYLNVRGLIERFGTVISLVIVLIAASLLSDRFFSQTNIMNVIRQTAIVGVLAIGMTFVILTAGIDLSVGSTLALVVVLVASVLQTGSTWLGLLVGLLVGTAVGVVNGLGVTRGRIPPFVMTLGVAGVARGLAFLYTGGTPIPVLKQDFLVLGTGYLGPVPIPSIVFILLIVAAAVALRFTPFGRYVYAIGSNEEAARLSGINVPLYKVLVYALCGAMAAVAGILYAAQLAVGPPVAGQGYELDAIAAVVVGGASLMGGQGSIWGTLLGALIIGMLANILNLMGVSPFVQPLAKGALIIIAVWVSGRAKSS